ncbi:unnamed protein product, partial [marine sediment metagenome]
MQTLPASSGLGETLGSVWIQYLNMMLPYSFALIFVSIGFLLSLNSAAQGANFAVSAAKWSGAAAVGAAKFAGRKTKTFVREKTPAKFRETLSKLATKEKPFARTETDFDRKGIAGWGIRAGKAIGRAGAALPFATPALRKIGEMAIPETELAEINQEKEKIKKEIKTPAGYVA